MSDVEEMSDLEEEEDMDFHVRKKKAATSRQKSPSVALY